MVDRSAQGTLVVRVFLVGLVLLVMLVGDPRRGVGDDRDLPPRALCSELDLMAQLRDRLVDHDPAVTVADLKDEAHTVAEVGEHTRALGPDARAGLHYFVGLFLDLPDTPTDQQLLDQAGPAAVGDQAHADALVAWLARHCGTGEPGAPAPA